MVSTFQIREIVGQLLKVSTESLNYSRFLESPIGDYFDRRIGAQLAVPNLFRVLEQTGGDQSQRT